MTPQTRKFIEQSVHKDELLRWFRELLEEYREMRDTQMEKDQLLQSASVIQFIKTKLMGPLEAGKRPVRKANFNDYQ